jgi:hypothetical protein
MRRPQVNYGVASGQGLGPGRSDPRACVTRVTPGNLTSHSGYVSAREATLAGHARLRYESDAWESHQSLGSRECAGGDARGSLTASRPERDSGWASGSRSGGSPHWQSS